MDKPIISIITPVYNEEDCLRSYFKRIIPVMDGLNMSYEIILVNDGSVDKSEDIIKEYCEKDKRIKTVNFSRNFGQQPAFLCGLKNSSGDACILIDADLQDPPEIFKEMIAKWQEGYNVVHGVRRVRKGETFFKKLTSTLFMKILSSLSGLKVMQNSGEFKLYDRKVVNAILSMPERSRCLRIQTTWAGFKQAVVEFDRGERKEGETKFTFKKLVKTAEAGIIPYSPNLLRLSGKVGIFISVLSALCFIAFIILAICKIFLPLTAWLFPTIALATGIIMASRGITDVYLGYMYEELKQRPIYIERDKINFGE